MKTTKLDWRQQPLVRRCERVDTTHMLLVADAYQYLKDRYHDEQIAELLVVPIQGGVTAVDRLREAVRVTEYWSDSFLMKAMDSDSAWNALAEPPRWIDVDRTVVHDFVRAWVDRHGRWPKIDDLRRRFGRKPTNVVPGSNYEGQETLLSEYGLLQ